MPKKLALCVLAVLLLASFTFISMMSTNSEDTDALYSQAQRTTQNQTATKVSTVISTVEQESSNSGAGVNNGGSSSTNVPGVDTTTWLDMCDYVHKSWGSSGLSYQLGGAATVSIDGQSYDVRIDCSGYVGFCIYMMGWANSTKPIVSSSDLTAYGFTEVPVSDLQPGDVVEYANHVQVYAEAPNTVYNWGSVSSTSAKYTGVTDISSVKSTSTTNRDNSTILKVYRPQAVSASSNGKVVFLDAGHNCSYVSDINPGPHGYAEARGVCENTYTVAQRAAMKTELESAGYTVITVEDCGGTLAEWGNSGRGQLFEQSEASICIQLHSNAGGGIGGECCYAPGDTASENLCKYVMKYYNETGVGIHERGIKLGIQYSICANTTKPCVLLEGGFGNDGERQEALLKDPAVMVKIAVAVRKGLDDYFNEGN